MGIQYSKLESAQEGWKDGLQWLNELSKWSDEYEERSMVPNKNNHKTAEQTMAILLYSLPAFMKPYGKKIVLALMDERLRSAMMYVEFLSFFFFPAKHYTKVYFLMAARPGMRAQDHSTLSLSPHFLRSASWSCATSCSHVLNSSESTIPPVNHRKPALIT